MPEWCYPVSGLSMDAIIFEFAEQEFMWDMIKCSREIEQNEVNLPLIIDGFAQVLKFHVEYDFWNRCVIRVWLELAVSFNTSAGTSLGPVAFSGLSSLSSLVMPIVPITRSQIAGNGDGPLLVGVERIPWWVQIWTYCWKGWICFGQYMQCLYPSVS